MRGVLVAVALALVGCAARPPLGCQTLPSTPASALSTEGFALVGRVNSLLGAGKLSGQKAIRLNDELREAQKDLRAGNAGDAKKLIDSVKGELP